MSEPAPKIEGAAPGASYAILGTLSKDELRDVWRDHWRSFAEWPDAGLWFDRHRAILAEMVSRGQRTICELA